MVGIEREGVLTFIAGVGLIVGTKTSVFVYSHWPISVSVVDFCSIGAVDGYLLEVGAKPMPVGVRVGEESALQHFIKGRLHTWN